MEKPPDMTMFGNLPGVVIVLAWLRRISDTECDRQYSAIHLKFGRDYNAPVSVFRPRPEA